MKNSNIEWTDHTFNPWIGCTKVSPGCAHCYAETLDKNRFSKTMDGGTKEAPVSHWGKGAPRHRTSAAMWKEPLAWNREAAANEAAHVSEMPLHDPGDLAPYVRPRVFCASLADWLDDEVPMEWFCDLLELWHACPHLNILALTKRPQNWEARMTYACAWLLSAGKTEVARWVEAWLDGTAPANVWIGTSVEDQPRANRRVPDLIEIPARVRFLSMEPLLGPVELFDVDGEISQEMVRRNPRQIGFPCDYIDWVIVGGESGPGARTMSPEWARGIRDQCADAHVAFFFKQWGGASGAEKKAAGRLLDGREWNEVPT